MIKKLTSREQKVFIVCLLTILIYAGYNGLAKPLMNKFAAVNEGILTFQAQLRKSKNIINKSKQMAQQYSEYIESFKQSETDEQVMASILSEIEEIASEYGLLISEAKPKKVERGEFHNKFSVSLIINSELIDILRFLHILQGQPHFYNLDEARFDKTSNRRTSAIKCSLVLSKILIP